MSEITLMASAKINIGLDVTGRRDDGYHLVRTIMQTIGLNDVVTVATSHEPGIVMTTNDETLPVGEDNLCVKAAKLLMDEFHITEGVKIHLEKRIPVAAGLAGGSTDAAAVLTGVNHVFQLDLTEEELLERAVNIGADVPYCLLGGTALAEGIGQELKRLPRMMDCFVLIAKPPIEVSTKYVYEHFDGLKNPTHPDIDAMVADIENRDLHSLASHMGNILEGVTVEKYPVIDQIKREMMEHGAVVSMMSGSGPTVFGFFEDETLVQEAKSVLETSGLVNRVEVTSIVK